MKDRIMKLASEEGFVDGIYNYCDRWCERCAFTSKCRNYAFDPDNNKISEEDTFKYLSNVFKATMLMLEESAKEMGIDLSELKDSDLDDRADPFQDPLSKFAKETAFEIHDWFEAVENKSGIKNYDLLKLTKNPSAQYIDSFQVIIWYNLFISVKLERAIRSASENEFIEYSKSDSNGSAKIALIALDRSIAAWSIIMEERPEYEERILYFLINLSKVRTVAEKQFPDARKFIRPGLDE